MISPLEWTFTTNQITLGERLQLATLLESLAAGKASARTYETLVALIEARCEQHPSRYEILAMTDDQTFGVIERLAKALAAGMRGIPTPEGLQ